MALVEPFMNKYVELSGTKNFELQADPGEAFLVRDIFVDDPANDYVNVSVDKASIMYLRVDGVLGNHCPFPQPFGRKAYGISGGIETTRRETILGYLTRLGLFTGIPVAEGQKMTIKEVGEHTQKARVLVTYEIYEPGDITKDMPNGTEATEYLYINYGDIGETARRTDDFLIDSSNMPAEYVDFPVGEEVPAKTEIDLLGVLGSDVVGVVSSTKYVRTTYLKLVRGRKTLFDEDLNGILMKGLYVSGMGAGNYVGKGISLVGNKSDIDGREPFIFPTPLTFMPGEELNVYVGIEEVGDGVELVKAYTEVGFIQRVRIVA